MKVDLDVWARLLRALEPFTPPADDAPESNLPKYFLEDYGAVGDGVTDDTAAVNAAFAAAGSTGVVVSRPRKTYLVSSAVDLSTMSRIDLAGSTFKRTPDRAWEEVDRWNAEQAKAERDLAVKAAVDAAKPNPRDRARDQLADAGEVVQRQFRSDQERIAELEAELGETRFIAKCVQADLARVPALVEALRRSHPNHRPRMAARCTICAILAEWEKP